MSVKCQVIMDAIEALAPRYLAESWDNVGLLVGSPAQTIAKVMICLDVSEDVIQRAIAQQVDLIISHHPLIFKPFKNLRTDLAQGRLLGQLLKANIAVYAAHTNLDTAVGGVNDVLAQKLDLHKVEPLTISYQEELVKLAVFVPVGYAGIVQEAIGTAGAGHIGNYSHCNFQVEGRGNFLPLAGAKPFIGKQGELESVDEIRIETIMPQKIMNKVVKAMLKVHPYEEVAYDLYPLKNTGGKFGLGRIGQLEESMKAEEFAHKAKLALDIANVRLVGEKHKIIKKVALCSGSGAEFIGKAAYAGADILVTGDVKYHEAQKALESGINLLDAGHFGTEMPIVKVVATYLEQCNDKGKWQVDISYDTLSKDLFTIV
ncbi:MAG: NGG1p interacting factor 3 protein [Firmicutes bacterium]|nr:NGG1p interacting factor 3 protein [Bacillota bacterium]